MCSPTQLRPGEPPKLWQELAYTFDSKGLWSAHIEQTVKEARQRLGAINRVKQYLRDDGVCIAYKAIMCSKLEYGNLIYWSAAETHLAS